MNDLTPTPLQNLTGELWYFSSRETVLLHPKLRKLSIVAAIIPGLRSETLNYTKRPWFIPTSLETLSLGVDFYLHTDCPALDFRDFKCLQHLTIDSKVLRGDNDGQSPEAEKHLRQNCHLPPSLRSLRFREYRERGRPDLLTLSIVLDWVMSGGLRNLENITAQSATFFSHAILGASVPDGKSFQQAFRAVGVELAVERVRSSLGDEHLTIDCKCCSFYWRYLDQWDN
ncbi:hypothetical protein BDV36DRAFT_297845 [Aspergillus pseudocaelatus]|uniref:Uncharacterized protein n=1 Tax=Aspergillus pseudocaelatus TaxID=1825620 RepID=A0ABQ6WEZ3_9EURO|nr:hypothetical protein BDV36DRAFT_297845 [Aspergillus pseudocaelatus]